jgi:hypothetical protein
MTTATAPAPITESGIRKVILHRLETYPNDNPAESIRQGIEQMADFMYGPSKDRLGGERAHGVHPRKWPHDLWDDLRREEAERLDELYTLGVTRALGMCLELVMDELVSVALAFAAEYPDAPRAVR